MSSSMSERLHSLELLRRHRCISVPVSTRQSVSALCLTTGGAHAQPRLAQYAAEQPRSSQSQHRRAAAVGNCALSALRLSLLQPDALQFAEWAAAAPRLGGQLSERLCGWVHPPQHDDHCGQAESSRIQDCTRGKVVRSVDANMLEFASVEFWRQRLCSRQYSPSRPLCHHHFRLRHTVADAFILTWSQARRYV